jgi:hypothetical protein
MAITIDEMHVEVQEPTAKVPAPGPEPPKDTDLREAMEILRERNMRLRAD